MLEIILSFRNCFVEEFRRNKVVNTSQRENPTIKYKNSRAQKYFILYFTQAGFHAFLVNLTKNMNLRILFFLLNPKTGSYLFLTFGKYNWLKILSFRLILFQISLHTLFEQAKKFLSVSFFFLSSKKWKFTSDSTFYK